MLEAIPGHTFMISVLTKTQLSIGTIFSLAFL